MGTSWAVGAAATLGAASVGGFSFGTIFPSGPDVVAAVIIAAAFAVWAYAIAVAAHGSKGALVALLVIEVAVAVWSALHWRICGAGCAAPASIAFAALIALVALASAWATLSELRSRRGRIQWGTAALFCVPVVLVLAWTLVGYVFQVNPPTA